MNWEMQKAFVEPSTLDHRQKDDHTEGCFGQLRVTTWYTSCLISGCRFDRLTHAELGCLLRS
jgi:hypothetical protein